ncbi:unnamed protein product [Discosporangium mesarthrocarpum]
MPGTSVVQVFCGYEHAFALTSDDRVLGWGRAQGLGLGNVEDVPSPVVVPNLCGIGVVFMAAGLNHSLALTREGDLYAFGENFTGQLGLGHASSNFLVPQKVVTLCSRGVRQMACGLNHSVVLIENGGVFAFGDNRLGALGLYGDMPRDRTPPPIVAIEPKPVTVIREKEVVQVACGLQHTAVLTSKGDVVCFGDAQWGKLGNGRKQGQVSRPMRGRRCVYIACGGHYTMALTDSGDLYTFGRDSDGQMGLWMGGSSLCFGRGRHYTVPTRVFRLGGQRIEYICAGLSCALVRTTAGIVVMGRPSGPEEPGEMLLHSEVNSPRGIISQIRTGGNRAHGEGHRNQNPPPGLAPPSPDPEFASLLPCSPGSDAGVEVALKGYGIFFGKGWSRPFHAMQEEPLSLRRLRGDISRSLDSFPPDVCFEPMAPDGAAGARDVTRSRCSAGGTGEGGGRGVEGTNAHLAILR